MPIVHSLHFSIRDHITSAIRYNTRLLHRQLSRVESLQERRSAVEEQLYDCNQRGAKSKAFQIAQLKKETMRFRTQLPSDIEQQGEKNGYLLDSFRDERFDLSHVRFHHHDVLHALWRHVLQGSYPALYS